RSVPMQPAGHPGRRDRQALPLQHFGDPDLAPGGLFDRHRDYRLLDFRGGAVLQHRLAAADLLQPQLAAFFVKLLETVEAVAAVSHHFSGLAYISLVLGQSWRYQLCLGFLPLPIPFLSTLPLTTP